MSWKEKLRDAIEPGLFRQIEIFEQQIELKRIGKLEDSVFGETRLRRGVYGQRYDNGQRHDGVESQTLGYPCGELTKGPNTLWDAPGMQRIKIPWGGLTADQMDVLADLSEEYSDAISHVTTRQDIQLHYIHIDDTPDLMYRLAAAGITTQEACGNVIRNLTACPYAGVCSGETFDVTGYAQVLTEYLLGHPDAQDFGRKFKIAFSGCAGEACGLTSIHDLGFIAKTREVDGAVERGFELYVGGGLGTVPHQAKLFDDFVPEGEIFGLSQAICRVFAQRGEKKNRARARMKFLIAKIGLDEFKGLVVEERKLVGTLPQWQELLQRARGFDETPLKSGGDLIQLGRADSDYSAWMQYNLRKQRQPGYQVVTVALPLGDISAEQLRGLADIARTYVGDNVRTTVEQNIVLRWVSDSDLPALYDALNAIGLAEPSAGTISDITTCPGTDTCKLGTSASRGLAVELRDQIHDGRLELDNAVKGMHVKLSGCFNSCGQHHISDLGFYGVSRKRDGHVVPHFQVVVGGQWENNGGSYGLAIGAVPSKRVPEVVKRLTDDYVEHREGVEGFVDYVGRVGRAHVKAKLQEFVEIPALADDPSFYTDWGDPRRFSTGDMAKGECAGEVVSLTEFGLAASEREVFEAQLQLEKTDFDEAARLAYQAMLTAAKALVLTSNRTIGDGADDIVSAFKSGFCDTKLFFDQYAGGKFASYLFRVHDEVGEGVDADRTRRRIEEASLFVEAAHACYLRLNESEVA